MKTMLSLQDWLDDYIENDDSILTISHIDPSDKMYSYGKPIISISFQVKGVEFRFCGLIDPAYKKLSFTMIKKQLKGMIDNANNK